MKKMENPDKKDVGAESRSKLNKKKKEIIQNDPSIISENIDFIQIFNNYSESEILDRVALIELICENCLEFPENSSLFE